MIRVRDLKKAFGPKLAVGGITFEVERGEVLGFLGPNGAGKSTTMRMITGFIPPTEGKVTVAGNDISTHPIEAKRRMGYLPENAPAYSDMTVRSFLKFSAHIRGLSWGESRRAVDKVIDLCFLQSVVHQSVDTLSKGYRHRTCFAQSIIHDPDILVMDEPTDGLDPNQKHEVRSIIKRMGEKKAIVFSTHILEEVEAVCSRAIIVDRGLIVADGKPEDLKRKAPQSGAVILRLRGVSASDAKECFGNLRPVGKVLILKDAETLTMKMIPKSAHHAGDLADAVSSTLNEMGWRIEELRSEEGKLDEVFRTITKPDTEREAV